MQLDDAPRDDLLTLLAEPYPCENCRLAARCEAAHEACAAFSMYVAHASELRWRAAPRLPTRALFEEIFVEERPAKVQMVPKRPRSLTVEERRRRNTARKQRWRLQQARDAASLNADACVVS
jgi:hypothetical protein